MPLQQQQNFHSKFPDTDITISKKDQVQEKFCLCVFRKLVLPSLVSDTDRFVVVVFVIVLVDLGNQPRRNHATPHYSTLLHVQAHAHVCSRLYPFARALTALKNLTMKMTDTVDNSVEADAAKEHVDNADADKDKDADEDANEDATYHQFHLFIRT